MEQWNMVKGFLILLGSVLVMNLAGCSWVIKSSVPKADFENTGWREGEICSSYVASKIRSYQYLREGVSISICPKFYGGKAILYGPPLIPIFPNFYLLGEPIDRGQFAIQIVIDSPSDVSRIDLSKIRIQLPQKEPLEPSIVKVVKGDEFYDIFSLTPTVSHAKATYYITYDVPKLEVKQLIVDIGNLQVNGQNVDLPLLPYRKDSQYHYLPLHLE